jgi:hypothetical protein
LKHTHGFGTGRSLHLSNTFVDLDALWERVDFVGGQLKNPAFSVLDCHLLFHDGQLLFGKGLFLADLLQNLKAC